MRKFMAIFVLGLVILAVALGQPVQAGNLAQQPTVSIATVTGTPTGPMITVPQDQVFVYVRAGPGPDPIFPKIGVLVTGQKVPALGLSGDYVQIVYMGVPGNVGWVYRPLVIVEDILPQITPPPTPTARVTPTLDPTLAAEYLIEVSPTPLPTFTEPAPLVFPTFVADTTVLAGGNVPFGFLIFGLAVVGLFGVVITLLRGR